jgi:hypothetical protein
LNQSKLYTIVNEQIIRVPKQKYRKRPPSHWVEPPHNDIEDGNIYTRTSEMFSTPISSLRRHIKEFEDPTPDPNWHYVFNEAKDSETLAKALCFEAHVSKTQRRRVRQLVIKYYDVFREEGLSIPIQGYKMIVDTGNQQPICVKQPHYSLFETPIMQKTIDNLLSLNFIKLDTSSPWGFRIKLAPKPHQEDCTGQILTILFGDSASFSSS